MKEEGIEGERERSLDERETEKIYKKIEILSQRNTFIEQTLWQSNKQNTHE